ncbi:galactose-specific lectin nattectin-like [Genypterus blacodes]|uniref:galactose-specific lectin nattectin-like n=1 Tax=Genypterus blacodes TaxID=154954 RepID=UPI003F75A3A4
MVSYLHLITLLSVALGSSAQGPPPHDSCCTRCPPGWTQFGNRCFLYNFQQLTMPDAEVVCLRQGGNLVSLRNGAELQFLRNYVRRVSGKDKKFWAGLSDAVKEGLWLWSDGSPITYKNWAVGEPNNWGGGEDCVEVYSTGNFNDIQCTQVRSFMCSKDL